MTYGNPYLIFDPGGDLETPVRLERVNLRQRGSATYDEKWLQTLIHRKPFLLPFDKIEGAFTEPASVCMELELTHGYVDNLLLTPDGGIVVVETKLFRNFESRRKVLAQILDYAVDIAALSYEQLQAKIRANLKKPDLSLFAFVCRDAPPEEEAAFVDAVARNLRLGRLLLLIVGDGIQEEAEELSDFLQGHIRMHFTLAMVEMAISQVPDTKELLVQPRVLSKSVQIERAVIRVEGGRVEVPEIRATSPFEARPKTLSEETFYEELAKAEPSVPPRLKEFVASIEHLGVFPVYTKSLSLKAEAPSGRHYQLGAIERSGRVDTGSVNYTAANLGRLDLGQKYQDRLAAILPDGGIRRTPQQNSWRVVIGSNEQNPPVSQLLDRKDEWGNAMRDYIESITHALEDS